MDRRTQAIHLRQQTNEKYKLRYDDREITSQDNDQENEDETENSRRSYIQWNRHNIRRWWKGLKAGWVLPAHAVAAVTLALVLLFAVDDRNFLVDGSPQPWKSYVLHQSDVTTLLSIAVNIVRLLCASWVTMSGWRMVFILLERDGATKEEVDRMVKYRLPPTRAYTTTQKRERYSKTILPAFWLLSTLTIPVQFLAPLLTGAVRWIPVVNHVTSTNGVSIPASLASLDTPAGEQWLLHTWDGNSRGYEVLSATGLTVYASDNSFDASQKPVFRRRIPAISGVVPVNSTLEKATVPFFDIHSIEWASSLSDLGSSMSLLQEVMTNYSYPALNVDTASKGNYNPLLIQSDWGQVTIVNTEPWNKITYKDMPYPNATVYHGIKWVIVALTWKSNCGNASQGVYTSNGWHKSNSTGWGDLPGIYRHETNTDIVRCFALGKMNFSAGVGSCRNCPVVQDGLIEWTPTTGEANVEPDPMAETAIAYMPEVMYYAKMITFAAVNYRDNLDAYTRGFLSVGYQASWNHLNTRFSYFNTTTDQDTIVMKPVQMLRSSITMWRVLMWLGANLLVTLAGIVVILLHSQTPFESVKAPASTLLSLDNSLIVSQEYHGKWNSSQANDREEPLRVRLVYPQDGKHAYFNTVD